MEPNRRIFIGMLKNAPNIFIMGECVDEIDSGFMEEALMRNAVRVIEIHAQDGRVGYQFHSDPYFTVEKESRVCLDDFILHRIETDMNEKIVKDYEGFLTQLRIQKSGLVAPTPPKPNVFMGGK